MVLYCTAVTFARCRC